MAKSKYSDFHAICKQHGLNYKDKVFEFTEGRTESLSSLSDTEYAELLKRMQSLNRTGSGNFKIKPGDKQRKKIIRLALTMHWGGGDMKTALGEIDEWCKKQKFKKGFMNHTPAEYDLLVAIFEQKVYGDYFRDLNK